MTEYTVHFQKGTRVGARSLRMVHVVAADKVSAIRLARAEFNGAPAVGYKLTRVDYIDENYRCVTV